MTLTEVIAVMRELAQKADYSDMVDPDDLNEWADALERAMRDKDEELDFLRSVKESRGKELDEKDAEIELLRDLLERAEPFTPNGLDIEGEPTLLGNQIRAALVGKEDV